MVNNRKVLLLLIIFVITMLLSSCSDAGSGYDSGNADPNDFYGVYADYYSTFDYCHTLNTDKTSYKYNYKNSIFNKYIMEKLDWEQAGDKVEYSDYIYYAIKPLKEKNFTEFSIYIRGENNNDNVDDKTTLTIKVYKVTSLKTNEEIPGYSDEFDSNTSYIFNKDDEPISSRVIQVKEGIWTSGTVSLKKGDNACTTVSSDEYLLIVFYNNTLYGKEDGLKKVSFQATNILICAK